MTGQKADDATCVQTESDIAQEHFPTPAAYLSGPPNMLDAISLYFSKPARERTPNAHRPRATFITAGSRFLESPAESSFYTTAGFCRAAHEETAPAVELRHAMLGEKSIRAVATAHITTTFLFP